MEFVFVAAFCVTTASCDDFYLKSGDSIILDCGKNQMKEVVWKLNSNLLLLKEQSGRLRKGMKSFIQLFMLSLLSSSNCLTVSIRIRFLKTCVLTQHVFLLSVVVWWCEWFHFLGSFDITTRAQIIGNSLKVSSLKSTDSGEYTCSSLKHKLYVASGERGTATPVLYFDDSILTNAFWCNL